MEARSAGPDYDERDDRFTLYADVQYPHRVRQLLAEKIFQVPEQSVRVVARATSERIGTRDGSIPSTA